MKLLFVSFKPALLYCVNKWFKALETGKKMCAVFFYLNKDFNSVPDFPLLLKLKALGLDKHIINWLHTSLIGDSLLL